jgi:hypothetical protein
VSWVIRISAHALEQAAERAGVDDQAWIVAEVERALAAGRVSARRPAWLEPRSNGRGLYAWTENLTTFVLIANEDYFLVVTTLTAREQAA